MPNQLPSWIRLDIPESRDIALLRPVNSSKGKPFETKDEVYDRANNLIVPTLRDRLPSIASRIEQCENCPKGIASNGIENCLLPICPICARHYRRYFFSEVLRIYKENRNGAQTATIYLGEYRSGTLKGVSLKTIHDRFRHQLLRCDFSGAILIGGTEVTYRHDKNDWLLHLHLLALGASQKAWDNLENKLSKYGVRDPLRLKPINNCIKQLSYLQKFFTYHRPGTHWGNNPARAIPLKKDQLCELASWACKHEFTDFTFCFGVTRRHGHFYKT